MPDREKALKGLACVAQKEAPTANPCAGCGYADRANFAFCVRDIADDALALLKEQEWISVSERLPNDDEDILAYFVADEESRIVPVNYANGVWFDCVFNTVIAVENITHWIPLPKPPTEGR